MNKTNKFGDEVANLSLEVLKDSRDKLAAWAKNERLSLPKAVERLISEGCRDA